ncbi:urease accessory protein UreF [Citrobacter portucalensis]|uniref:urease accessory protein UreF n=1 Tax=Citrobacter portucalensis TaxID=1639133 RepID=UPI004034B405
MHSTQKLRLMQLASSSLPVGSFTWSQGLEWAVEIGWVKSVDDFSDWQVQQMEQNFFTVDLPLLARLYRACELDDLDAARRWSTYLLACRETRELRDEERSRGAAFTRLVTDWESDCSREWRTLFVDSQLCGMAWLGVRWKIPLMELALSLGYSWIESAVMAGVKLVPFGQQAAQRLIIALCDRYAQGLSQALTCPDTSLGSATPLAAIASARHETQYSRLFRS